MVTYEQTNNGYRGTDGFKKLTGLFKFNTLNYCFPGNINYARLSKAE